MVWFRLLVGAHIEAVQLGKGGDHQVVLHEELLTAVRVFCPATCVRSCLGRLLRCPVDVQGERKGASFFGGLTLKGTLSKKKEQGHQGFSRRFVRLPLRFWGGLTGHQAETSPCWESDPSSAGGRKALRILETSKGR